MLDRLPIGVRVRLLRCGLVGAVLLGGRQTPERGLTGARPIETDFPAF